MIESLGRIVLFVSLVSNLPARGFLGEDSYQGTSPNFLLHVHWHFLKFVFLV